MEHFSNEELALIYRAVENYGETAGDVIRNMCVLLNNKIERILRERQ